MKKQLPSLCMLVLAILGPVGAGPEIIAEGPASQARPSALLDDGNAEAFGDRGHHINMIYPPDAFYRNGGPIIDVTQPPYRAKGSGDPADAKHNTESFIAVCDFLMAQLDKYGDMKKKVTQPSSTNCSYIVYIPNGVYYVNDTIVYSGPVRRVLGVQREYCIWLRFIGQSRANTVIRLADNCPGFGDRNAPKPILSFGKKTDVNPMKANNAIKNLTIDAGRGNPGAIGIRWTSANNGIGNELFIRSSDGRGFSGYDFTIGGPCGYFRDIIVDGFDYGIRIGTHRRHFYNPVLEYITVKHQKRAGILCEAGSGTLRKIKSVNSVAALKITDAYSHVVLLDSHCSGGGKSQAAIDIVDEEYGIGHLLARNITVSGYGAAVRKDGAVEVKGSVSEYVSDSIKKFAGNWPDRTMNLPIEELPYVPWEQDLSKWTTAGDRGGARDDSKAIQEAMNDTTKSVVYFPRRQYRIGKTVNIPAHIEVVDFMFCRISGSVAFRVSEDSPKPIYFRDLCKSGSRPRVLIEQDCGRTVYTELIPGRFGNPGGHPGARAFLCSTGVAREDKDYSISDINLFWRWGNDEYRERLFTIGRNSTVVMLGYKTEGGGIGFTIADGAKVEILGGVHTNHGRPLWYTDAYPYIRNNGGECSITTRFMQGGRTYSAYVEDTQAGVKKTFASSEFGELGTGNRVERIVPLYIGYKNAR